MTAPDAHLLGALRSTGVIDDGGSAVDREAVEWIAAADRRAVTGEPGRAPVLAEVIGGWVRAAHDAGRDGLPLARSGTSGGSP